MEDLNLCLQNECLNTFGSKTAEDLALLGVWRLFARFQLTSSLKTARSCMTRYHTEPEIAQGNTIYRCKYCSTANSFRPVHHSIGSKMYRCILRALDEKKTFLTNINKKDCPAKMTILRNNMHWYRILHEKSIGITSCKFVTFSSHT